MKISNRRFDQGRFFKFLRWLAIAWLALALILETGWLAKMYIKNWFGVCPEEKSPFTRPFPTGGRNLEEIRRIVDGEEYQVYLDRNCTYAQNIVLQIPLVGFFPLVLLYLIKYPGYWSLNYIFPKKKGGELK